MRGARYVVAFFVFILILSYSPHAWAIKNLKTLTFSVRDSVWVKNFRIFSGIVEKASGGAVKFTLTGGPEAVPPFEQIEALKRGIVDVALLPGAYFVPQLPEADAMKLSRHLPWEERKIGIFAFYQDLMKERLGVYFLGKITAGTQYHFYLKKMIEKPDMTGLKIRVTPIYEPFVRALGGAPVTMAPGEVYIALERGVVDGFGWPSIGVSDLGWHETVRYIVSPGFYQTDVCVLFNLKTWNGLSEETRNILTGAMERAERESHELSREMADRERVFLLEKGVKLIRFKGEEERQYIEKAYRAGWEKAIKKSPVAAKRLREMMER